MVRTSRVAPVTVCLGVCASACAQPQFYGVGHLPPMPESRVDGVGIGGVATGYLSSPSGPPWYVFRWTPGSGMQQISSTPGYATALTPDGQTIVGSMSNAGSSYWEPFRWTPGTGPQFIGNLSTWWPGGAARAVSADGQTIAGYAYISNFHIRAFRWTPATGMQNLGTLPGLFDPGSEANAISADGQVIVGSSSLQIMVATRWDSAGIHSLGSIPGAPSQWSNAYGANADGSVIVGQSNSPGSVYQAFRWTAGTGMVGLGTLPGAEASSASEVSYDGRIVLGWSGPRYVPEEQVAMIWTPAGMRSVDSELTALGVTAHQGWSLRHATTISPDARWIGGHGINPQGQREGWVAYVGDLYCYANCDGSITPPRLNVADFACFLASYVGGDLYANCDGSTTLPMLNISDFTCFLQKFAAGCP